MVTLRDRELRSPAFELARRIRKPDFRAFMSRNGYVSGTTVVVAHDDERVEDVFARIAAETEPPVVLAIWRPTAQPWGFVFMTIGPAEQDAVNDAVEENSKIGKSAKIGMLYDTMAGHSRRRANLTIPNEWQPAKFRVAALAGG